MLTLAALAHAIHGRLSGTDARFDAVTTDSRTLQRGSLFVALRGERFDGHDYVEAALDAGAAGAMVDERSDCSVRLPARALLVVDDTRAALGRFAAWWRARHTLPLIAVVGSNGKTTVKEMIATILRVEHGADRVLATEGNLNNDIGLPLTLLRLRDSHRAGVVELGMNHPGETALLAAIARPTVGLVNNAQREHQEFMKTVRDVAIEHGALLGVLPAQGTAVYNADDAFAPLWRGIAGARPIRDFALEHRAAVTGHCRLHAAGAEIEIVTPEGVVSTTLAVPGEHNVRNALGAAAAASATAASLPSIAQGLAAFVPVKGRLQVKRAPGGSIVIDDSYNANPDSVRAAIDVLARASGVRILVLGDMGEVGELGPDFHREIGRYARDRGIDRLLLVGALCEHVAGAFGERGEHFDSIERLGMRAAELAAGEVTLLVKGSRFMRMERVVERLMTGEADAA